MCADKFRRRYEKSYDTGIGVNMIDKDGSGISCCCFYLKISKIASKENLQNVLKELSEAYSYLPKEIVNLCNISYIRHLASHILAQKVVINEKNASIHFESINDFNANIVDALSKFSNFAVSNMQKEPIIYINSNNDNSIFELLIDFLSYCIK